MQVLAHAFANFDGDPAEPANLTAIGCEVGRNDVGDYSIFLTNGGVNIGSVAFSLQGDVNLQIGNVSDTEKSLSARSNTTGLPTDSFTVSLGIFSVEGGGVSQ